MTSNKTAEYHSGHDVCERCGKSPVVATSMSSDLLLCIDCAIADFIAAKEAPPKRPPSTLAEWADVILHTPLTELVKMTSPLLREVFVLFAVGDPQGGGDYIVSTHKTVRGAKQAAGRFNSVWALDDGMRTGNEEGDFYIVTTMLKE